MLCNHYAGRALTADRWNIFLIDVLFVRHLHVLEQEALEQETDHPDNHLDQIYLKSTNPYAEITTMEAATMHTTTMLTNVTAVEMTTRSRATQAGPQYDRLFLNANQVIIPTKPLLGGSLITYNTGVQLATQDLSLLTLLIIYAQHFSSQK